MSECNCCHCRYERERKRVSQVTYCYEGNDRDTKRWIDFNDKWEKDNDPSRREYSKCRDKCCHGCNKPSKIYFRDET
jgi:hypothetical protein